MISSLFARHVFSAAWPWLGCGLALALARALASRSGPPHCARCAGCARRPAARQFGPNQAKSVWEANLVSLRTALRQDQAATVRRLLTLQAHWKQPNDIGLGRMAFARRALQKLTAGSISLRLASCSAAFALTA